MTRDSWRTTYDAWHMMHDAWHMIQDIWLMTHDKWCMTHGAWRLVCNTSLNIITNTSAKKLHVLTDVIVQKIRLKRRICKMSKEMWHWVLWMHTTLLMFFQRFIKLFLIKKSSRRTIFFFDKSHMRAIL